ncbi:mitochondrial Rho GTPase 1 [Nadsonia fulvescens var. elongata DSM 6958]|uniref:Mitochondrial Rho GTPase n=1 Tax=Nadsonia fulvescens var. elongata DSM 6958 TaxID=857566 RepID=A0A1E3PG75_9ASCO|nr:mitochondrial Rho GTPase 1 [Nadsonia fulvescens var. elongata DSM 6958]
MTNDIIRIVVCGDEGVGKSSIITSLVKDAFVPNIQHILPSISIPRGFSTSPDAPSSTVVVDTSALPQDRIALQNEIRQANVIWLVYSDPYTCERISLFWLPFFRSMGVNLPVVLCANQCDLSGPLEASSVIAEEMIPILKEFKEIESCIRCSAKLNYNINQAFYLCQRAVIHPIAPLFDSKEGKLKPAAVSALQRVFFLCDKDQDGYLNDSEILDLQIKCFSKSLDKFDLAQLKSTISKLQPSGADINGITEEGFILLNKLFAEKGRHETTWGILRVFHYTDSLSLNDKFLYPRIDVPENSSVELSPEGYKFFVDLFLLFDKDNDGGLNEVELNALFKPTPGIPRLWQDTNFPQTTVRNERGYITLQGWLAQWSMTTYLDFKTTMAYLALLGFETHDNSRSISDGLKVTKSRKKRNINSRSYRNSTVDRTVFNCFVLGASASGKSTLLDVFLNKPFFESYRPTIKPVMAVNSVEMHGGKQCYMILEELGELEPAVLENQSRLDECDVLCYTYDSSDPDSFSYLVELRKKFPILDTLPAVYVALKADLDRQQQRCDIQPDQYTRDLHMSAPLHVSAKWPASLNELFVQLAEAAQMPGSSTLRLEPEEEDSTLLPIIITASVVGCLTIAASLTWKGQR